MAEGYCGKSCAACDWRERLECPGCQEGPGRAFGADCGIAACCRAKGHQACATCTHLTGCPQRAGRDRAPEERIRRAEAADQRRRELDRRAPLLGKWLWPLFWLVIPSVLGNLMTNETVVSAFPGLRLPGEAVTTLCTLAYGVILWQLRRLEDGYRAAAVCRAAVAATGVLAIFLTGEGGAVVALLLLVPALIVQMYGTYREYNAHAAVLDGADDAQAENWRKLWKWEIGLVLGLIGCTLLAFISLLLGALALLADAIGLLVTGILRLVYLYRTAKLFREHIPSEKEALPE